MTFEDLLNNEKSKPSPFDVMVEKICAVTCRSRQTVINWYLGKQRPNEQAQKAIARLCGLDREELFPQN